MALLASPGPSSPRGKLSMPRVALTRLVIPALSPELSPTGFPLHPPYSVSLCMGQAGFLLLSPDFSSSLHPTQPLKGISGDRSEPETPSCQVYSWRDFTEWLAVSLNVDQTNREPRFAFSLSISLHMANQVSRPPDNLIFLSHQPSQKGLETKPKPKEAAGMIEELSLFLR